MHANAEEIVKIGPSWDAGQKGDLSRVKGDGKRPARTDGSGPAPDSNVRISDLSSRLTEMQATLGASEAFDTQRVAAIKQAITDGRFKVNPEAVADKLLANVREMLEGKSGPV